MKKTILDSLKNRKFRFGGYATLLVVAALAIVVGVNLVVDQIPAKLDMTQDRLYSLSDQTKKLLDGLDVDVTITTLGRAGTEDKLVKEVLDRMAAREPAHPARRPSTPRRTPAGRRPTAKTGNLQRGQPRGGRLRDEVQDHRPVRPVQLPDEPADVPAARSRASRPSSGWCRPCSSSPRRSSSPSTWSRATTRRASPTTASAAAVTGQNYEVKDLDLIAAGSVPADADVVLLASPGLDLSAADADHLRAYLAGGGRMLVLLDLGTARRARAAARGAARQLRARRAAPARGRGRLQPVRVQPALSTCCRSTSTTTSSSPLSSANLPLLMPVRHGPEGARAEEAVAAPSRRC